MTKALTYDICARYLVYGTGNMAYSRRSYGVIYRGYVKEIVDYETQD